LHTMLKRKKLGKSEFIKFKRGEYQNDRI
jgi:hypothetical protein